MIKVKLTENYTGFNIEGTYDDFYELYDCVHHFLKEGKNELEEDMRLHILGFLYDLRHAYQKDRSIKAVDNGLSDKQKKYYGIKKSVKEDILYSFDYLVTDLILDILLFRHFTKKQKKEINEYNTEYNVAIAFYSKVVNSLSEILTPTQ